MLIATSSATGAIFGGFVVLILSKNLRELLIKKYSFFRPRKSIQKIWDSYGSMGLGFMAPLLTGIPLGVALGISFGANANILMRGIIVGAILWASILTVSCILGFELIYRFLF